MNVFDWVKERYIYFVVVILLALIAATMFVFAMGKIGNDDARVYIESFSGIATLALLYFAYFNMAHQRKGEVAQLELAVRPIFIWEIESKDGGAELTYKTQKHPIYDLHGILKIGDRQFAVEEQHLDVFEANPMAHREKNVTQFVSSSLGKRKKALLEIFFVYHSEAGGRYELFFTKEVVRKKDGYLFQHRKFISARYPWNDERIVFTD